MKAVFCLALVLAVVAADSTEVNTATPEDILKETTFASSSTPSSLTFSTTGAVQQRDFSFGAGGASFGSGFVGQSPISGSLFHSSFSGVPVVNSRSGSGFSESSSFSVDENQKDVSLGSQGGVSSSFDSVAASGAAALANGAFKGSNNAFLKSANGIAWNSVSPISGINSLNNFAVAGKLGSSFDYSGYNPLITSYHSGYGNVYGGHSLAGIHGHSNVDTHVTVDTTQQKHINTLHTITKQVAVPQPYPVPYQVTKTVAVPHPYPVQVTKAVPVPYNVNVPVPVDKPYPVKVPSPVAVPVHVRVPVPVEKPYPVQVEKIVRVPVVKPVYVRVPQPVAVRVPQPYPVKVAKPVAVQVPTPVVVKVPEVINIHKVDYAVSPSYGVNYDYGNHGLYGVHSLYGAQYGNGVVSGGCAHNQAVQASLPLESHNYLNHADQVHVAGGSAAQIGSFVDSAYEIQPANLVGSYEYPSAVDGAIYPSVEDAKFAFKRETAKHTEKKEKKEEKKHH
ncbi:hypothetical protein WA026_009084 [Henosepilachna vigintioctopunctata]|uniref:Uncharacterized protein n=1 Tax=Henosepilachna vigintioctopunctata TaxID=420089 RepID=A0AAW1UMW1_9CUCU